MPGRAAIRRRWLRSVSLLAIILWGCLGATAARAQVAPGDTFPSRLYFATMPAYYDGDYRAALNGFQAANRSGIGNAASKWIDSICYLTMMGECQYQLGQMQPALANYDAALKLYVSFSDWMMRVQFPPAIGSAPPGAIRASAWGQSKRGARIGQFPDTFLMGQGLVDNSLAVRQGGVIQAAMLFPVNVAEIVRVTSLAIRRRRELLGPLGKFDPLTTDVVNVLSRRPGPTNHWSQAWVQVQLGCAYSAAGNAAQASTILQQALLVGGEYDHPLTSTALLELGRISLEAGDFPAASRYLEEASYASVTYPNLTNLEEAFRYGALAHLLLNQKSVYPPLAPAIAWARAQNLRELQVSLELLAAENMAVLGETAQAVNFIATARTTAGRSDLLISRLGAQMNHLTALTAYQAGNVDGGDQALAQALTFQRSGSLWMFQIRLADARYTAGNYGDRVGMALYDSLLRDPLPGDWAYSPLESLSVLTTPHEDVLEHWFEAALENSKEQELALEIADRTRRHRYFNTLAMGGRLLALRWILEGPPAMLGERGLLERQELLGKYPEFQRLSQDAAKIRENLAGKPAPNGADAARQQAAQLETLAGISQRQEVLLRQMAVRREPADMVFPPLRKTADVQKMLPEGQLMLAFFQTSRHLYAFLYSSEKYASWRVQSPAQLEKQVAGLLRDIGNFDANHELPHTALAKDWHAAADKLTATLLSRSNVELAGNFNEIVVVPDGFLWYLPFELLSVGKPDDHRLLLSKARVRYAPTVGLAVPYDRVQKPRPHIGVVLGKLLPQDDDAVTAAAFEQMASAVNGAVALPRSLPVPSSVYRTLLDGMIVLDDVEPGSDPYDWSPAQVDRGKAGSTLADWLVLPWGGPEQIILPGFHTQAESALRRNSSDGREVFLSVCGLMSAGARTILISRWRTGGQSTFDLVREFAQELPHSTPAEAWQRSVQVASDTPLDATREPRLHDTADTASAPKAGHPFFWSGYMLIDSGVPPDAPDQVAAGQAAAPPQPAKPLVAAGIGQQAVDVPPDEPRPDKRAKKDSAARSAAGKKAPAARNAPPPADEPAP